jgi:hypothetical protein
LSIGGEKSAAIADTAAAGAVETILQALTPSTDVTVSGTLPNLVIAFAGDYAFSGINVEVASSDATVTVAVARKFPISITSPTEGNGYYKLGLESNLDKTFDLETQDVTNKDSGGNRETASQIRGVTINPTNFFLSTGNFLALRKQWEISQPVIICDITPEQYQDFAVYNIKSLNQGATVNQVVDFTAEFERTGATTELTS